MSLHDTETARHHSEVADAELTQLPVPKPVEAPRAATGYSALQARVGNAGVAAAATSDSPADDSGPFTLYSSYGNAAVANALVQRKPEGEEVSGITEPAGEAQQSTGEQPATEEQQSTAEQPAIGAAAAPAAGLIVEDSTETLELGQMKKSNFLSQLRTAVSATAREGLADTPWSEAGCPYIGQWFGYYSAQDSQYIERAIRRYAPEAAGATTASGYVPIVAAHVRQSVTTWATTGKLTGVPEGVPLGLPGGGVMGAVAGAVSGVAGAVSGLVSGAGRALPSIGSVLFKEREGGAKEVGDPQAIQTQLGAGQSLDGGVKSRMESAFGESFSGVQVHTGAAAAGVSANLNARALTVGEHVAFGAGEYQPGTLIGDALIAHELAHVIQQGGSLPSTFMAKGGAESGTLEEDADRSAVHAVVSLWSAGKGMTRAVVRDAMPRLKAGLRLQRCAGANAQQRPTTPTGPAAQCAPITATEWTAAVQAAQAIGDADQRGAAMTRLAEQALCSLGIQVHTAGSSHTDTVHPDDYQPVPTINFDVRLHNKTMWRGGPRAGTPIGANPGYNFNSGSTNYAMIGPNALNPTTPLRTRDYAQHELYMTSHAASRPRGENRADFELETWTEDFRNYFHQYLVLPIPQRPEWGPLIDYYEKAGSRQDALNRLVDYYRNPPIPAADHERFRRSFAGWMRRRNGRLIEDLDGVLHVRRSSSQ